MWTIAIIVLVTLFVVVVVMNFQTPEKKLQHRMVSVGSTNFDMRSFELNDEASVNVYDSAFALQMTGIKLQL